MAELFGIALLAAGLLAIVMNTAEELTVAFEEYQKGTFIKNGQVTD